MSPSNPVARFSYGAITQGIRIVILGGDPWFVARDVLGALGLVERHASRYTQHVPSDEKSIHRVITRGGPQPLLILNESGLYRMVMRSDAPAARVFQDWIARDVIPTIRRTGSYSLPSGGTQQMSTQDVWGTQQMDTPPDHDPISCAAADLHTRIKRAKREIADCTAALKALQRVALF